MTRGRPSLRFGCGSTRRPPVERRKRWLENTLRVTGSVCREGGVPRQIRTGRLQGRLRSERFGKPVHLARRLAGPGPPFGEVMFKPVDDPR